VPARIKTIEISKIYNHLFCTLEQKSSFLSGLFFAYTGDGLEKCDFPGIFLSVEPVGLPAIIFWG